MQRFGTPATVIVAVIALLGAALVGALIAIAAGGGRPEALTIESPAAAPADERGARPRRDLDLDDDRTFPRRRAREVAAAAVAALGGGTAVEVSRSDDPGESWEVEVIQPEGGEVDVALDSRLRRVPNAAYED